MSFAEGGRECGGDTFDSASALEQRFQIGLNLVADFRIEGTIEDDIGWPFPGGPHPCNCRPIVA